MSLKAETLTEMDGSPLDATDDNNEGSAIDAMLAARDTTMAAEELLATARRTEIEEETLRRPAVTFQQVPHTHLTHT